MGLAMTFKIVLNKMSSYVPLKYWGKVPLEGDFQNGRRRNLAIIENVNVRLYGHGMCPFQLILPWGIHFQCYFFTFR